MDNSEGIGRGSVVDDGYSVSHGRQSGPAAERAIRVATVAAVAAFVSYRHMRGVALECGEDSMTAAVLFDVTRSPSIRPAARSAPSTGSPATRPAAAGALSGIPPVADRRARTRANSART
ncbi:DUF2637 domain-containing protein [Frankia sp. Cas4]|uniref:DUF2637 domain-containing protein n=1 Tax=Frankia sp. Cas4 TaxID=3073927 RepID=UPI002AD48226|nr:DUF2637 domain-containing protein [Frankia sp. Cas4]